jgi:hypothetical protein
LTGKVHGAIIFTSEFILYGKCVGVKRRTGVEEVAVMDTVAGTRLSVRSLLRALDDGWQAYPAAMKALSPGDRQAYLVAQGYAEVRDLLAQATAWAEETLGVVPMLLQGGEVQRYDEDAFNAQAIARFSYFADAEVERRFAQAYATLARLLALLPERALAQPDVYERLRTTIVDRFNERRPPNMARLP